MTYNYRTRRELRGKVRDTRVRGEIRSAVWERDEGICQLCGQPVNPEIPGDLPWAPSLDHIVAFADGGRFEVDNLQLAHRRCNWARHNERRRRGA